MPVPKFLGHRPERAPRERRPRTPAERKAENERAKRRNRERPAKRQIALELHRSAMLSRLCPAPSTMRAIREAVAEFDAWDASPKGLSRGRRKSA
jgi:hypothetical protein